MLSSFSQASSHIENLPTLRAKKTKKMKIRPSRQGKVQRGRKIVEFLDYQYERATWWAHELGDKISPLSVWSGEHTYHFPVRALNDGSKLPAWEEADDELKAAISLYVLREIGCLTFTAKLHPAYVVKWLNAEKDIRAIIRDRLRTELKGNKAPYLFVIEGHGKKGELVGLHIHGLIYNDPTDPEALTIAAFKRALRRATGNQIGKKGSTPKAVNLTWYWGGKTKWIQYIFKNIRKPDPRLQKRRIAYSHSMIEISKNFYRLIKGEKP